MPTVHHRACPALMKVHFFLARGWVSRVDAQHEGFLQTLDAQPVHDIDQAPLSGSNDFRGVARKRAREDVSDLMFGECRRQSKSHNIGKAI